MNFELKKSNQAALQSIAILQKPKDKRTMEEKLQLYSIFTEIKLFEKIKKEHSEDSILQLCECIQLCKEERNKFLFHFGDKKQIFYLILKGRVQVLIPSDIEKAKRFASQLYKKHALKNVADQRRGNLLNILGSNTLLQNVLNKNDNEENLLESQLTKTPSNLQFFQEPQVRSCSRKFSVQKSRRFSRFYKILANKFKVQKLKRSISNFNLEEGYQESDRDIDRNKKQEQNYLVDENKSTDKEQESSLYTSTSEEELNLNRNVIKEEKFLYDPRDKIQFMSVTILNQGESFGEQAILQNTSRAASVLCLEDCYFAALDKSSYQKIIKSYHSEKFKQKIHYLKNLQLFNNWKKQELFSLNYFFNIVMINRNEILFRENEKAEFIYFIIDGEIQKSIQLKIPSSKQQSSKNNTARCDIQLNQYDLLINLNQRKQILGIYECLTSSQYQTTCKGYSKFCNLYKVHFKSFSAKILSSPTYKQFIDLGKIIYQQDSQLIENSIQNLIEKKIDNNQKLQFSLLVNQLSNNQKFIQKYQQKQKEEHSPEFFLKPKIFSLDQRKCKAREQIEFGISQFSNVKYNASTQFKIKSIKSQLAEKKNYLDFDLTQYDKNTLVNKFQNHNYEKKEAKKIRAQQVKKNFGNGFNLINYQLKILQHQQTSFLKDQKKDKTLNRYNSAKDLINLKHVTPRPLTNHLFLKANKVRNIKTQISQGEKEIIENTPKQYNKIQK